MTKLGLLIEAMRAKRLAKIIAEPNVGFLDQAWAKRGLAITAVVASWAYLISLYPFVTNNLYGLSAPQTVQFCAAILMAVSYVLLRRSLRRLNSLPDEMLDERQIADRDWAFKSGYLVVRRIGLGVFGASVLIYFYSRLFQADLALTLGRVVQSYFSKDTFASSLILVALLTYVAYSFPLILLAWREARHVDNDRIKAEELANWKPIFAYAAKVYFRRLRLIGYGAVASILLILIAGGSNFGWFNVAFATVFYALFVYAWGMLKVAYVIRVLGHPEMPERGRFERPTIVTLFTLSSVIGASVGGVYVLVFASLGNPFVSGMLPYTMFAGAGLVILHVITFVMIRSLGRLATD